MARQQKNVTKQEAVQGAVKLLLAVLESEDCKVADQVEAAKTMLGFLTHLPDDAETIQQRNRANAELERANADAFCDVDAMSIDY